ncbi:hypothetical protein [Oceaniovalibus sp. ACAM 378]|uniref:hypothetical protein n=1 Tax=Oceaniovalibus sp. ACAM 378 TaxID=2599923 RepID=UPI0011D3387B|nr:hypothetical protein [Oceaniovalibus sp. ACAM 378]TYB90221.1 hypothetical protein FQ320_05105 [Oceaniovalibus sp. ACAM 378]
MKAIIHIGMPKAGSTTIQECLWANRDTLLENGVVYSRMRQGQTPNREIWYAALLLSGADLGARTYRSRFGRHNPDEIAGVVEQYANHLDETAKRDDLRLYVASSEHLYHLERDGAIEALDRFLHARFDEVHYVAYLRCREDFLLSRYSQHLRSGGTLQFDQYLDEQLTDDFAAPVDRWVKAVGADRITLRLLEPDALTGGDLVTDFLTLLNVPPTKMVQVPRQNEAFSAKAAVIARAVNEELSRDGANQMARRAILRHVRISGQSDPRLTLNQDQRDRICAATSDANEKLRLAFFPDRDFLFTPRGDGQASSLANTDLPDEATARTLATDLIAKLRSGQILTAKGHPARLRNLANKGGGRMRKTGGERNTIRDAQ